MPFTSEGVEAGAVVFACVDASDYMPSVCHHAAWIAERLHASLRLLHASASPDPQMELLTRAAERLQDEGFEPPQQELARGAFLEVAAGAGGPGDVLVLGRRGRASQRQASGIGVNIVPLIRRSVAIVLVAPRLFMPVSRALVRRSGAADADRRLDSFLARTLGGVELVTAKLTEVDMICCPRELLAEPAAVDELFAARRPVLVV